MTCFEIYKGKNDLLDEYQRYYFRLTAENGETIFASEGYNLKRNCYLGIESFKANCNEKTNFERKTDALGGSYYILRAYNGEAIGISEIYSNKELMDDAISLIMNNASKSEIQDLTLKYETV